MKKFLASLTGLVVVLSAVILFNGMSTNSEAASLPRDCDNNSIIYCGATTPDELKNFYKANKTGDLPAVYNQYGLTSSVINSVSNANLGEIHKDGRITLGGKVVATGASSIGRQDVYKPSTRVTINGKTYFEHEPKSTFGVESIKAFVFLDQNGKFIGAILTSCANPFKGHPTPVPTYKCDSLTAAKITREKYDFVAKASVANGATITGYTYNFGDGKSETSTSAAISHTYATPGVYTAVLTANVKANDKNVTATAPSCQTQIVVEEIPKQPVYRCDTLSARVIKLEDRSYAYDLAYTAKDGAALKTVDYDFGDGQTKKDVAPADVKNVTHEYVKAGTYKTVATLHFTVGNEVKDVACEVSVTISPEMCPLIPSLPKDDVRCAPCPVPGKEQYPKDSPKCAAPCDVPGKEHLPKDSLECVTPPVTPPETPAELPRTGPAEVISGSLGLGSLIAASYYWFVSRRSLIDALLNR